MFGGTGLGGLLQQIMGRGNGGFTSAGLTPGTHPLGMDLSALGGGGQQSDFTQPQGRLGFDLSALGGGGQQSGAPGGDWMRQQRLMSALGSGDGGTAFGAGLGNLLGNLGMHF